MLLLASSSRESRKRTTVHRVMLGELGVGDWIGELHVWGGVSVWRSSLIACPGGAEVCSLSASAFTEIPNCLGVRLFEAAQHKYRKRQAMLDHGVADSHARGFVLQRPSLEQHVVPHFASKLGPRHVTSKLSAMVDRMVASRVEKIPSKCKCVVDARQALRTAMGFPKAPTSNLATFPLGLNDPNPNLTMKLQILEGISPTRALSHHARVPALRSNLPDQICNPQRRSHLQLVSYVSVTNLICMWSFCSLVMGTRILKH